MDSVEIHIKRYGISKSKDPQKDNQSIGLETRLIIRPEKGKREVLNFDYQPQAIKYLKGRYGDIRDKKYQILSNFQSYGERGYKW